MAALFNNTPIGTNGWVVPSTTRLVSDSEGDLTTGALNAFAESSSTSSFDVTIDTGEAIVQGAYLARDTTTTVTLSSSTNNQDVYVGWKDGQSDTVIIGKSGDFGSEDPMVKIWTFDTDGSGVTSATDQRPTNRRLDADEIVDGAGVSHTGELADLADTGVVYVQSGEPSSPSIGETWYDTDTGVYYIYGDLGSGAEWHPVPPVTILEEASTFAESDVTITHNKTQVANGSIEFANTAYETVDDFESGDLVVEDSDWGDWAEDTSALDAQQNVVLSGSWSGELTASNAFKAVSTSRSSNRAISKIKFLIRIDTQTGDVDDEVVHELRTDGNDTTYLQFAGNGDIVAGTPGSSADDSWSANTTYTIEFIMDYANDQYDVKKDGTTIASNQGFRNSASDIDEWRIFNNTLPSGSTVECYFDDVQSFENDSPTSGDALVEWSSGNPTDIQSWLDAGYQVTLDNETVTIDVENGSGTVLQSDIGHGYPLDTDTDVDDADNIKLRANLSRSNTSNNPTCDYLYRRFTR